MNDASPRKPEAAAQPAPLDWALFWALVAIGGSSFVLIRASVDTIPPAFVAVLRMWVGAAFLYALMRAEGGRLPPLLTERGGPRRISRAWLGFAIGGVFGYSIPFLIFPWAQQFVATGLAGVYMAFMPLWTLGLATAFTDEKLTGPKIAGFALGFLGVVALLGPDALAGLKESSVLAQGGLLLATFCYAVAAVASRRFMAIGSPRVFSTGVLVAGAAIATPAVFFVEAKAAAWSLASLVSVVCLGIFQTGLAGVILVIIIRRVNASFMALANYVTPLWAVALGALIYGERLAPSAFVALALILAGVAVSRRQAT